MKRWVRIAVCALLVVAFVLLFCALSLTAHIPGITDAVTRLRESPGGLVLTIGLVLLLALDVAAIVLIFTAPSSRSFYTAKRDRGSIRISKTSLTSLVGQALKSFPEIQNSIIVLPGAPSPEAMEVRITLTVAHTTAFAQLAQQVQQRVADDLQRALNLHCEKIHIQIQQAKPKLGDVPTLPGPGKRVE